MLSSSAPRAILLASLLLLGACASLTGGDAAAPEAAPAAAKTQDAVPETVRLLRMARGALESGNTGAALSLLRRVLEDEPQNAEAARLAGRALLRSGRASQAADMFRRVLAQGPDLEASLGYARALLALGHGALAARHLEEARRVHGERRRLLNALGIAYSFEGRQKDAARVLEAALAAHPGDVTLTNNLALVLALAGRYEEAVARLRPLADGLASTPRLRQNLALVYGLAGDFAKAARIARIDLDDDAVETNIAYFRMLRELDGTADAARLLHRQPKPHAVPRELRPEPFADRPPPPDELPVPVSLLALDRGEMEEGKLPLGEWVLRLGLYGSSRAAAERWQALRRSHGQLLEGLVRLDSTEEGPQPLLAGPVGSEARARAICARLRETGQVCDPLRL